MVTVAEGIAALKGLPNVVLARFESIENVPDATSATEGEPPQVVNVLNQYSILTVRVISIKGGEATQQFVKAVCFDFGGSQEAVYLLVENFSS